MRDAVVYRASSAVLVYWHVYRMVVLWVSQKLLRKTRARTLKTKA
jgi:hypothetical protein